MLWRGISDGRRHTGTCNTFPPSRGPHDTSPGGADQLHILCDDIVDRYVDFAEALGRAGNGPALCDLAVNGDPCTADRYCGEGANRGSRWIRCCRMGDVEYELGHVLWTRIDDMGDSATVVSHFDAAAREAGMDRDRARDGQKRRWPIGGWCCPWIFLAPAT